MIANRFCHRLAHCSAGGVSGFRIEEPLGDLWVVDEFDFEKDNVCLEKMSVLAGVAEGADAVFEVASVVFTISTTFALLGSPPKGLRASETSFTRRSAKVYRGRHRDW